MRVLLDECLPRNLKCELHGHHGSTVPEMGWAGAKNGVLLRLLQQSTVQVFITVDGNLEYQQNLRRISLSLIVLKAPDNTIETLRPLAPRILVALQSIQPGDLVHIAA